jgi:hypothetical protein
MTLNDSQQRLSRRQRPFGTGIAASGEVNLNALERAVEFIGSGRPGVRLEEERAMMPFQRRAIAMVVAAAIIAITASLLTWQVLKGHFHHPGIGATPRSSGK